MVDRLVVVGASAGGLQPLRELLAALPGDLPAAVAVVLHLSPTGESRLPELLSRGGALAARHATEGEALTAGSVVVAPPDRHLTVLDGRVHLSRGPRVNRQRPAVDVLFRSAARSHAGGVVAVVLSGALDDGAVGSAAVAAQDGTVLVQDPAEARVTGMPRAALTTVRRARAVPTAELGPLVADLVRRPLPAAPGAAPPPDPRSPLMSSSPTSATDLGAPAALGCPDCQGGMYESTADGAVGFTCHVGHSWSAQSLLQAQGQAVEDALYNAASKLLETASVHRRLAGLAGGPAGEEHLRAAERAERRAARLRAELDGGA
ncbi:chemotaxis protein CheB [Geodermatophilus sp. SYSU D01106]